MGEEVNRENLYKLIKTAAALELSDYTQESRDALIEKLNAAQDAVKEAEKSGDGTDADKGSEGKKIRLKVRNKTGRPTYYRAGLCFAQVDAEYEVTKDVADILLVDPWLVAQEVK